MHDPMLTQIGLMDVKVGDTLYDCGVRRDSRMTRDPVELTVTKVARTYLYATGRSFSELKICRENGYTHRDWDNFTVYRSKEQFLDRALCKELSGKIVKHFGIHGTGVPGNLGSDQLQKILDILEGKE